MALRYNERTGMFDEVPEDPRINSFTFDGNPIRYKDESITNSEDLLIIKNSQEYYLR